MFLRFINLKTILFVAFTFLATFQMTVAQTRKVIYPHKAFWSKYEVTQIFENKWGIGADYIFRTIDVGNQGSMFSKVHRHSIRPWIHYQFSKNFRISLSPVSYFGTDEYIGKPEDELREPYNELRTTVQILHHHKMMGEKLTHTFRHMNEIRFRSPFQEELFYTFFRYRMRYRLRYLLNKDYYSEKGVVYATASVEFMINYGSQRVVYNMFNQNRVQVGAGYRFLPSARVELRYLNRLRTRGTGFEYDRANIFMVGLFVDQISSLFGKDIRPVKFFD